MQLRLTRTQLNELELILAGAYGTRPRYHLPTVAGHVATLLIRDVTAGRQIELLDTETTPIAVIEVDESTTTDRGTWVAGTVTALREPATPPFAPLRPGPGRPLLDHAVLAVGHDHVPGDEPVIHLDAGDPEALSRAVHTAQRDRRTVRVLPEPAAEHLDGDARIELLSHLAEVTTAGHVTVSRRQRAPRGNGLVVLFTGLSGSGKSTIARQLTGRLRAETHQRVTLLDGDEVRAMLSSGLGFSRADRELNVRRIGWVASQLAAHGGIAICAPIAPYRSMRDEVRTMAERAGRFVLVHVATPLEVCEARDRKGLYAKARAGEIAEFTGISDPYEDPTDADVTVGAHGESIEECTEQVLAAITGGVGSYII
ncbi:adenylyl-sulfate kinase [Demequina sp. SYSU T00039]|uniref:Adenylyl-sulfate kinase n=1 Tax=Demequina lignilytica TaxID=3051663 RepID=A0AAW7M0M9_9MICO|nr:MULTISPECIES: adenylyl-sulfate kinase [unclassified Demequina]MDN4477895.1 adenylyl-sulfate kinase [Demequina sp. SYSU T00039-1]MDN4487804.1 adenylyl-sulfate kinase [Demequina sp. SYSU T00039]